MAIPRFGPLVRFDPGDSERAPGSLTIECVTTASEPFHNQAEHQNWPDWFDDNHDSVSILQHRDCEENGVSGVPEYFASSLTRSS